MKINIQHNCEFIPKYYDKNQLPIGTRGSLRVDLLSPSQFLEQVQRAERLADRSKDSYSIALLCFNNKSSKFDDMRMALKFLKNNIRETDIIGYLDENVISILLPATDEKGAQGFKKRIIKRYASPPFSITIMAYPDDIFNNLLAENQNELDFSFLLLKDSTESNQCEHALKRGIDVIGAFVGILLLSPLMLITALAIKATSPGPVIFKQIRVGKNGVTFTLYKFRSMLWNADDQIHREYITDLIHGNLKEINQGNDDKPLYKIKSDPRVTRVGRIIRKTSIDELPQLFNVFKGDMSLVGPRPPLPYEVENYLSWHLRRVLKIKPGITGLWQVDGRSVTSFDDMVRFDIQYILNWSLMLDLKIIIKTVKAVLRSTGAV